MRRLLLRLEDARPLDRIAGVLGRAAGATVARGRLGPALHGSWFGHPLHPAVVQFPIGAWLSAAVLDALPERDDPAIRRATTVLLGAGTAAALPAVATGGSDFTALTARQRRVAVVHAAANVVAVKLFAVSVLARMGGAHRAGRLLSLAGLGLAGASAYLGGHLAYSQGAGVEATLPPVAARAPEPAAARH
ncbi:DUF2231 domain-containing protein [Dactylosporangium salmoneum]|uniref:DUF2231 domain-containing protein n=1 Tax=Dactylosporangium salmoneum TaxID=53361 RepID=A0ABN3FBA7_9ACTN